VKERWYVKTVFLFLPVNNTFCGEFRYIASHSVKSSAAKKAYRDQLGSKQGWIPEVLSG